MERKPLLAAMIVTAAVIYPQASLFAQSASHIFSGTVATIAATPGCASVADIHAQQALFRPHILAGDPKAAIILGGDGPLGGYGQLQDQSSTKKAMNGTGSYDGKFIDPQSGQLFTWVGTYDLTVTPVSAATIYIYMTGTISNFANVATCAMTINAAFIQPVASN
jgi:hypothetical protein